MPGDCDNCYIAINMVLKKKRPTKTLANLMLRNEIGMIYLQKVSIMKFNHTKFLNYILIFLVILTGCDSSAKKRAEKLKSQIELIKDDIQLIEGVSIQNPELISEIYEKEAEFMLENWGSKDKVNEMLSIIRDVSQDGLRPDDYHLPTLEFLVEKIFLSRSNDEDDIANLELLLTDAFLLMSSHLSSGKTDPATIDPQWNASKRETKGDLRSFVDSALVKHNLKESLQKLSPGHREYKNLKKALRKYREIESNGGWELFSTDLPKIAKDVKHPDVAKLRKRLMITQDNVYDELEDEELFDQILHEQVVLFQKRNGLTADGVVAKATIEAMNIPVEDRIASIEANLERWRWVTDELGEIYIKVNIANFEMQVVKNDSPVFVSEAIVGRPFRKTPVFSASMNHLVLAPTWTVPPTILSQDVIPAVKKNQAYLRQKNMEILRSDGSVVDPASLDWKNLSASNFPYRVRQAPGKDNALGAVKFMFPNKYSVYIHDTPSRELFVHADRSFSSGCIRIKRPLEFASFLLQDKPEWTMDRINTVVRQGKETTVFLTNPIPVHILYLTAWAEEDGTVHFRKDIYNRDKPLLNALKETPPTALFIEEYISKEIPAI
jgi:L,D-transpeptidase YcbB